MRLLSALTPLLSLPKKIKQRASLAIRRSQIIELNIEEEYYKQLPLEELMDNDGIIEQCREVTDRYLIS